MLRIVHYLVAAAVFFTTLPALAAFSVATGYPRRDNGRLVEVPVEGTTPKPLSAPTAGFSRLDCLDVNQLVKLRLVDIPSGTTDIEIWARRDSTTCADPANRPGGTNVQCWKVASWTRDEVINKEITFSPIQVVSAIDKQTSVDSAAGLDPTTVCAKDSHMLPVPVYLQVMAFGSGTVVGWSSGTMSTGAVVAIISAYDLAGPNPPTNPSVGTGNGLIVVDFSAVDQPVEDFDGYKVYCYPENAGSTSTTDGGALSTKADDAGLSDGGVESDAAVADAAASDASSASDSGTSTSCVTGSPFVAGKLPSAEAEKYLCKDSTVTAGNKLTVTGLKNGVKYAIAIGSRDKYKNSGVLSEIQCGTPKETDDFYTVYRRAGGTAGGGWCAIGSPRGATFGIAGIALVLALAARIARRGRR